MTQTDKQLTDAEVICEWMEPRETVVSLHDGSRSKLGWWVRQMTPLGHFAGPWFVRPVIDLDALHEVEARLSEEQRDQYCSVMWATVCQVSSDTTLNMMPLIHATAEQKIKALSSVIRHKVNKE